MVSMGYGYKLDVDMPGESRGFIPNTAFYDKIYGKDKWVGQSIISDAIGQGEILATPLQIANLGATIANRGHYITPHVVKEIKGVGVLKKSIERHDTKIDRANYDPIVEGMRMAVLGGTCRAANLPGIEVCGKTGTAQNPHGRDHSVFMGFAPMNDPKIAVCVYVENGGWGATYGVPIGSLMIEKYLRRTLSPGRMAVAAHMGASHTVAFANSKAYGPAKKEPAKESKPSAGNQPTTVDNPKPNQDGTKE